MKVVQRAQVKTRHSLQETKPRYWIHMCNFRF